MKNLTLVLFAALFLFACTKKEGDQPKVETDLNISRIILAPDRILVKKQERFHISLRYWKEENLSVADVVTLTVNGVNAKRLTYKPNEPLSGSNVLFEVPPINTLGDAKLAYSIKSNNKIYTGSGSLKIVDNYSIHTVWNNLNRDYVKSIPFITEVYQSGDFTVIGASTVIGGGEIIAPEPLAYFIGNYRTSYDLPGILLSKPFIQGLDGMYIISYDSNDVLKEIRLTIGNTNVDPNFDKAALFTQLATLYGSPTTNNNTRTYRVAEYDIEVTDDSGQVKASIKKAR